MVEEGIRESAPSSSEIRFPEAANIQIEDRFRATSLFRVSSTASSCYGTYDT
jgi:hypothetical protein